MYLPMLLLWAICDVISSITRCTQTNYTSQDNVWRIPVESIIPCPFGKFLPFLIYSPLHACSHHTSKNDNDSLTQGPHTQPLLSWTHYIVWEQITPLWDPAIHCSPVRQPHLPLTLIVPPRCCLVAKAPGGGVRTLVLSLSDPRRLRVWKGQQRPQANLCGC